MSLEGLTFSDLDLPLHATPAAKALTTAGLTPLDVAEMDDAELLELDQVGKGRLAAIRRAMAAADAAPAKPAAKKPAEPEPEPEPGRGNGVGPLSWDQTLGVLTQNGLTLVEASAMSDEELMEIPLINKARIAAIRQRVTALLAASESEEEAPKALAPSYPGDTVIYTMKDGRSILSRVAHSLGAGLMRLEGPAPGKPGMKLLVPRARYSSRGLPGTYRPIASLSTTQGRSF